MKRVNILIFLLICLVCRNGICQHGSFSAFDSSQIFVQNIIRSKIPVLVDFWASWCKPCEMLTPIIDTLKKEFKGKIKVLKVNIDRNQQFARHFRVVSIPTIFLIDNKIVVKRIPGVQPKEVYISAINEILGKKEDESEP